MNPTPEPLTLQERIDLGETIFLVRPQHMIAMAKALERNGDHDLAAIIKRRFPHLFPRIR